MTMKFRTPRLKAANVTADVLLVGVYENTVQSPMSSFAHLDAVCSGSVARQAAADSFTGKTGAVSSQFTGNGRVVLFGLGDRTRLDRHQLREALEAGFKEARKLKAKSVAVAEIEYPEGGVSRIEFGRLVGEVAGMTDYVMNHFKTEKGGHKKETRITEVVVACENVADEQLKEGLRQGRAIAAAVNQTRDLVNLPAANLTPMALARHAEKVAAASGGKITCKLTRRAALRRLGANAFLAVSQGSDNEPVLIELDYNPAGADPNVLLTLIGKSVTFDSGGNDIKPADGMRWMKCDMAGGATTLSAIQAIAAVGLPVRVKVLMAATENLINGKAYKPGDVLHSLAGLTIEVDNTDAEGRLTLADAIEYAKRNGATHIVDVATLTGAIKVALGTFFAGAFTNNPELMARLASACDRSGELVHELPMHKLFAKANESKIADLKNSGGSAFGAGSITAAWFLRKFAGETPWVHLDVAGVAFKDEEGTGWGVRALIELARDFAEAKKS